MGGRRRYTMQDLVEATGFTARTIRSYIGKGLVPRAGMDQRGPNATYGRETLWKLRKIAELKEKPVGPANRPPTLEEIRHALQIEWLRFGSETELMGEPQLNCMIVREHDPGYRVKDEPADWVCDGIEVSCRRPVIQSEIEFSGQEPDFEETLRQLKKLLLELAGSTSGADRDAGEAWRRIGTPDIEFHVRVPEDDRRRARLLRIAEILDDLMSGGS